VLLLLLSGTSCRVGDKSVAVSPQLLATLFEKLQSGDGAPYSPETLAEIQSARRTDPNWPTLNYLVAEFHLKRNDVEQARTMFRNLAVWAASDQSASTYKDGWGVSSLAAISLWRWLQILDTHGGAEGETAQALTAAAALQRTRLFAGITGSSLLPALPLIEEDVARLLSHIAWKAGRPEATALFLDFVSIDSTGELDAIDEQIKAKSLGDGMATPERLDLFRSRRQLSLVMAEPGRRRAAEKLKQLWENQSAPAEIRAEAGYEWGHFYRQSKEKKLDVVTALSSAFQLVEGTGPIAEKALYMRGMVQNSVKPKRPEAFFADLNLLLDRFPNGRLAGDAMYELAAEYLFGVPPDQDRAFSLFEKLRTFQGRNDWLDSAYVVAALGLLARGADADLRAADRLLASYTESFPDGAFRLRCLFWRGRIAERRGDAEGARRFYQQAVDEVPYDYYGIRASMHLEGGASAISIALPESGTNTWNKLREAYRKRGPDVELAGASAYHDRLRAAERSGLYGRLLPIVDGLGRQFHRRLDTVPLRELDERSLIPAVVLQLALRQDALAARDAEPSADNQLRLAGFLGRKLGDWPTAIAMTTVRGDAPHRRIVELQNDPRFLSTTYPGVDALVAIREPLADAAWQIEGSTAPSECLMYAVIRQESRYYPGAISSSGAIGLFQIMPLTFGSRRDCWILREAGEKPTATSYLFDPARNAQFWSCWVKKEFKPTTRNDIVMMLVKHQAGGDNLLEWMEGWKGRAFEHDLELQIDAFRFPATQAFVRRVLADIAVVDASGIYQPGADTGRR
jgi:hypothetical protein